MKLTVNPLVVAVGVMASVLLSGHVQIQLQHHLNLPPELSNKSVIEVTTPRGLLDNPFNNHRVIHIRLAKEIKSTDSVKDIAKALQEADSNDTVVFHIVGVGGEIDTVLYLINNIKETKAHTVMIVEGPSYSGHAYLATAGDELHMMPESFLMFHTSSAYGVDCKKETGTDRTVSNVEHCEVFLKYHLALVDDFLNNISILSAEQKQLIKTGHDVFVTAADFNKSIKK